MGININTDLRFKNAFIGTVFRLNNYNFIERFLSKNKLNLKQSKVLDIGCGNGINAVVLSDAGIECSYLGIDLSDKYKETLWRVIEKDQAGVAASFKVMDANSLSREAEGQFDLILCITVLEHIKDFKSMLFIMKNLLSTNGHIIITVPSVYSWMFSFGKHGYHYFKDRDFVSDAYQCGLKVIEKTKLSGLMGYIFDFCFSWYMAIMSHFSSEEKLIKDLSLKSRKRHLDSIKKISFIDKYVPFLESGYGYILTLN